MRYYALIECKCFWRTERSVQSQSEAEAVANEHEARDVRRPYRHETTVTLKEDK